jgi:hypothetical protein
LQGEIAWLLRGTGGPRTKTGITAFGEKSPDLVRRSRDAELLYPVPQRVGMEAEDLGGAAGAVDQPEGCGYRVGNHF